MGLNEAAQIGTVDDVRNLIDLFIDLMTALSPLFVILIIIYVVRRIVKRINAKAEVKQNKVEVQQSKVESEQSENTEKRVEGMSGMNIKEANQLFENEDAMMEKLNDITEPENKNKYNSLCLEFGLDGKVVNK